MRQINLLLILILFILSTITVSWAQNLGPEMMDASKKVHDAFDQNLKGWRRENVEPFMGESNIIVENWIAHDRGVRISIALMRAEVNNNDWLSFSLRHDQNAKKVEGIGDFAVSWGYADTVMTFHRGRFNVSVSSTAKLKLLSKSEDENLALSTSEATVTTRLVACFINLALSGDLTKPRQFRTENRFLSRPCEQELVHKGLLNLERFTERL